MKRNPGIAALPRASGGERGDKLSQSLVARSLTCSGLSHSWVASSPVPRANSGKWQKENGPNPVF